LDKSFDIEVTGLGMNMTGYPGGFTPVVQRIIREVIYGNVLHLYSGSSEIGDVRIDLSHKNATVNCDVAEFIAHDPRHWDFVILDPPYAAIAKQKLEVYAENASLSGNVKWRNEIRDFFRERTSNVLWLDFCVTSRWFSHCEDIVMAYQEVEEVVT
jgi:hypothetical protein